MRSSTGRVLSLVLATLPSAALRAPLPAQTAPSLTIYNDGRVLVRRTVPGEVPRGTSTVRVPLPGADPGSLFSSDSAVTILAASVDPAPDPASILRRALGRRLLFRTGPGGRDTVSATLVGVDPERYRFGDGTVSFTPPGTPLFPEDLVPLEASGLLAVRASSVRPALRLAYFTGGAQWSASYQVVLMGAAGRVSGSAVIASQSLRADSAEVQLLAGAVSQAPAPPTPRAYGPALRIAEAAVAAAATEQRVGEVHLYSLPARVSLLPGTTSTVALFDPAPVSAEKSFVVRGTVPYWGGLPQEGEEQDLPVSVSYRIPRAARTEFGGRPLPGGVVRLYQPDDGGRLQLIGETTIDHTPAGEDLRLDAGEAFDLSAKRVQTSYVTRRDSLAPGVWQTSATADYRVTLRNATEAPVTIDVLEQRGGEWSVLSSSVPPEKLSSTVTRFKVPVPAGGRAVLRYRVKVIW